MADHLISTIAAPARCPRCHIALLVAYDEGLTARVDAQPLDQPGEIAALVAGLTTYTLQAEQLIHRTAARITGGTLHGTTHAQHACPPRPQQTTIDELIGQQ